MTSNPRALDRGRLAAWLAVPLLFAPASAAESRPQVAAISTAEPMRVDGVLDEPAWRGAESISRFLLILVREGETPSESTEVRALRGPAHLYFGIRCWNRAGVAPRASLAPRDQILDDDHIAVHLDTYRDRRRAYIFGVNPYGVQLDGILDGDAPDFAWDSVWDAECARDSGGWTAEIAIPLRTLRFPAGGQAWGLWLRRQITRNDEVCSWPLYRLGQSGAIMLQGGDLTGMGGLRGGGKMEIQPYVAATQAWTRAPAPAGTTPWSRAHRAESGADFRYGITSTLTANVTINPDYSQVEADALQFDVNQRFPLFFAEKRPFFLEGAETYTTPLSLVYTRRIADPAFGAKFGGKVGRWRLGAIGVRDQGGGSTEGIGARSDGGPAREGYFGVARATYDLGENSSVGLLWTHHRTDAFTGDPPTAPGFPPPSIASTVTAADASLRLAPSLYARTQVARSSSRTDSVPGRDRFADWASTADLWWDDGTRLARVSQDYLGSEFRADAGFLERVDIRKHAYEASVTVRPENRWLRNWEPQSDGHLIRDTRGTLQERQVTGELDLEFQGQTSTENKVSWIEERWHSRLYDRRRWGFTIANSLWRPLAVELALDVGDGIFYGDTDSTSYLGWEEEYTLAATVRPSPRLTSEVSVARSRFTEPRPGPEVYDVWLLGAKTTWQFTRRLYARLFPQYDTGDRRLEADALLGYVLHPGSVVYVGFDGRLEKIGGSHRGTGRTVFLKVSYRFQG